MEKPSCRNKVALGPARHLQGLPLPTPGGRQYTWGLASATPVVPAQQDGLSPAAPSLP